MSFKDVKAIYDSLPREQQLLVSPSGRFVDSPNLVLRTVDPGNGFAEAYKIPGNKAFVTVAVAPDAQGNGKGMELLHNTIARANAEGIGRLVYRLNSNNNASRALVRKFVDKPHRTGKDWEEYIIDTANVPDPYYAELPPSVTDAMESVKGVYKDMGYDLSDVALKGATRSRFWNGAVVPFSVLPEKQQVGASWVPADNSVYFHPDIKAAMKLYGVKGSPDKFIKTLAAHELAHAVDQRYADDAMRKQVLEEARKAKFTTPYLDNLPFEEYRDKEIFAEWLASKNIEKLMEKKSMYKFAGRGEPFDAGRSQDPYIYTERRTTIQAWWKPQGRTGIRCVRPRGSSTPSTDAIRTLETPSSYARP